MRLLLGIASRKLFAALRALEERHVKRLLEELRSLLSRKPGSSRAREGNTWRKNSVGALRRRELVFPTRWPAA